MERRLRLRAGADFQRVRAGGRHYNGRLLRVTVAQGRCAHNRYGLVTGRQTGGAVRRNRLRRLLREAVRSLHPGLAPGHDLVIVARPGLVGKPLACVCQALRQELQRAGMLAGEAGSG